MKERQRVGKIAPIKKTTIVDIAKSAGVSVSTVSRILNNKPDVAEETRQRVLQVIEEQRFTPQMNWQQLRSGKSRFITLHFPQDYNPPSQGIMTSAARLREESRGVHQRIDFPNCDAEHWKRHLTFCRRDTAERSAAGVGA